MKTVAIIQARMGSTRLPGKVLIDLEGETLLMQVVHRARRARMLDAVCVAVPDTIPDRAIVDFCDAHGIICVCGSENDLLDRYRTAAISMQADAVVRITADCPLIDPLLIDRVVERFIDTSCDYASNCLEPRTYPRGLDVEVFSFDTLERIWNEDINPAWREHVTPYIYRKPHLFHIESISNAEDCSSHRWTVDTPEDLELVRRIYRHFGHDRFGWEEVISLFEIKPEWFHINQHVAQKEVP